MIIKSIEFLTNCNAPNLTLHFRREWSEDNFLIEASDQFRAKEPVKLRNHRSLERSKRQPGGTEKLVGADVAGADNIKSGKIMYAMVC